VSSEVADGLEDSAKHGECLSGPVARLGMQAVYQSRQDKSIG
jgi:hypothetical protein